MPETDMQWQDEALCAQTDPDLFFPEPGDNARPAIAMEICRGCPVIAQCKELGDGYEWGIFGGMTPNMRRKAQGPWRGSTARQLELSKKGVPIKEIARLCQVTERTVQRTIAQSKGQAA